MTIANTLFDGAVATIIEKIGELGTYYPLVGNPVASCSINIVHESDETPAGFEAVILEPETTIEYLVSEIPTEANKGDYFITDEDSTKYIVKEILENTTRTVKCAVKQDEG